MSKRALIFWGGWEGHHPQANAEYFAQLLRDLQFDVKITDSLDTLLDYDKMKALNLIVPIWTLGKITDSQLKGVRMAVKSGVGLAGSHGGMGDAFRETTDWQWMVGGQFVSHPGGTVKYKVRMIQGSHPIVEGLEDFEVESEQYLMQVDPSNRVLATTEMPTADGPHVPNGKFDMPVIWTRRFGEGKVFYVSIGHTMNDLQTGPMPTILKRGFAWAAR